MGYMKHNAIVITSWDAAALDAAIAEAKRLGLTVLGPSPEVVNGYTSALVCPDGSKEGWADSDLAADARDALVKWMTAQAREDGSSSLDWIEIRFGGDDPENARIVRHHLVSGKGTW